MVVIGGNLIFTLELEDTEVVNEPVEGEVYWTRLTLLVATIVVNIAAAVVIWRKEDTPINRLITWDCLINAMTAIILNEDRHKLSNAYLCSIVQLLYTTLTIWNRLVPVGIAAFRYVLVCITAQCCVHTCCSGLLSHLQPSPGCGPDLEDGLRVCQPNQPFQWRSECGGPRAEPILPALHGQGGNIQVRFEIVLDD
jgi:hypothetical protein